MQQHINMFVKLSVNVPECETVCQGVWRDCMCATGTVLNVRLERHRPTDAQADTQSPRDTEPWRSMWGGGGPERGEANEKQKWREVEKGGEKVMGGRMY